MVMASIYTYQPQEGALQNRHRSQSDSNLLTAVASTENGDGGVMLRMGSVGELSPHKIQKKKGFFHRLVRPWKWRKRKRGGKFEQGERYRQIDS